MGARDLWREQYVTDDILFDFLEFDEVDTSAAFVWRRRFIYIAESRKDPGGEEPKGLSL